MEIRVRFPYPAHEMLNILKLFFEFIFEIFLYVVGLITGILELFFSLDSVNPHPTKKYPIVFVHGWFAQSLLYFFLKRCLEKKGFLVYMANVGHLLNDLDKDAVSLKRFIDKNELKQIILVGVSAGGLVSYRYLQKLAGWTKVKRFISLGTPFKGSLLAQLGGIFLGSARQMTPGSSFLNEIKKEQILQPDKIICIRARYDELVSRSSSLLPGTKQETVICFGHIFFQCASLQTMTLIAEYSNLP